jgi:hypothetical protein
LRSIQDRIKEASYQNKDAHTQLVIEKKDHQPCLPHVHYVNMARLLPVGQSVTVRYQDLQSASFHLLAEQHQRTPVTVWLPRTVPEAGNFVDRTRKATQAARKSMTAAQ